MSSVRAKIRWSEEQPPFEVSTLHELDNYLDQIAAESSGNLPTIVEITAHGYDLSLGLGLPQSFVQIKHESGNLPYLVTVGNREADGAIAFFLFGEHHTEIPQYYLIPVGQARKIVHGFVESGVRPSEVEWEEV